MISIKPSLIQSSLKVQGPILGSFVVLELQPLAASMWHSASPVWRSIRATHSLSQACWGAEQEGMNARRKITNHSCTAQASHPFLVSVLPRKPFLLISSSLNWIIAKLARCQLHIIFSLALALPVLQNH